MYHYHRMIVIQMSSLAQQNLLDYSSEVIEDKSLKTNQQ